jgi:hypothetical protein
VRHGHNQGVKVYVQYMLSVQDVPFMQAAAVRHVRPNINAKQLAVELLQA